MGSELIASQVTAVGPQPVGIEYGTNLLLPNRATLDRFAHFPEEVYDLSAESHLVRFLKALTGDAGAGQLRKRLIMARLQQSLQGIRFHDLDRFYGSLFGIKRTTDEALTIDPYFSTATSEQWTAQEVADASYRSRISQFAKALAFGPTPTGIELVAEALLSVDCDVYETYEQADGSYQTYGEIEVLAPTVTVRTNLCTNSGFETDATNWESPTDGGTLVRVTSEHHTGIAALQITTITGLDQGAVASLAGVAEVAETGSVIVSAWVKAPAGAVMRVRAAEFTPAPASVGDTYVVFTGIGNWQQVSVTRSSVTAGNKVRIEVQQTTATAQVFYVDDVLIEAGVDLDDYFDGDTPDVDEMTDVVHAWTGTAHASTSTETITGTDMGDLEDMPFSVLEGAALDRLAGDERREFVVRPKRMISQAEAYDLGRVLRQIKPADARFVIDYEGSHPLSPIAIRGLLADSNYWEVVPKVTARDVPRAPYTIESSAPVEQPRPPFTSYQGEAWSYITEVIGVAAFHGVPGNGEALVRTPTQRVTLADGTTLDYPPTQALTPKRYLLAGRSISDGVLVAHPYWAMSPRTSPDLAPLFTDRINLDALNGLLMRSPIDSFPQNPIERFWASPERMMDDETDEIFEISLTQPRQMNYLSVETARFPHSITVQVFQGSEWVDVGSEQVVDSNPAYLPPGMQVSGHPQHSHPGHWRQVSFHLPEALRVISVRFVFRRIPGTAPKSDATTGVAYSLAMRSLDLGFRVYGLSDVPTEALDGTQPIGATIDPVGSKMEFYLRQQNASGLLESATNTWKSEPQPINFSVVNLYLDVRDGVDDAQVIDRFFLDPTHPGVHLTIYYTEAVGEPSPGWYAEQVWQPIMRDYRLQKGFVHIPPTAARHFKFEFTSLAAEPHETMMPLTRTIRMFPQALIDATLASQGSASILPGGLRTAIEVGDNLRYADAMRMLRDSTVDTRDYLPTEVMYASNPQSMISLREQSWAFGWTPWHQGSAAPRWSAATRHAYDTIEMRHTTTVGFFVGLKDIQAFRTDPGEDDDVLVYDEHFHDFRNIEPGFTWTFNPGALETVLEDDCVATSRVYASRHNVWALQFATQQTAPVQVVPDDDLRDPALASIDWTDNPDGWHQVGDSIIVYSPVNHSARLVRYSQPLLRPTPREGDVVQEPVQEVFSYRPWAIADATQTTASWGGIETTSVGVSSAGQVYVAIRFAFLTQQTSPLILQVLDGTTEDVIMEYEIEGGLGEIVEKFFPFPLSGSPSIRARVIQRGISDDIFEVDRLSIYDPGIRWEFSVDGGVTWVPVEGGVRNNAYGFVTFPDPGNQLMWRVTGMRLRMSLSSLRMRVHYQGLQNARYDGAQRGPNVSVYDEFPPITDDTLFTTWSRPVPRDWFMAYRQFPMLVAADGPTVTEFARFYGRPVGEAVNEPSDGVLRTLLAKRSVTEVVWVEGGFGEGAFGLNGFGEGGFGGAPSIEPHDTTVRVLSAFRSTSEAISAPTDQAYAFILLPDRGIVDSPLHPPL